MEGQFNELEILKGNKWIPIQPIAKKMINKVSKVKRQVGSSTFSAFLKSKSMFEFNLFMGYSYIIFLYTLGWSLYLTF